VAIYFGSGKMFFPTWLKARCRVLKNAVAYLMAVMAAGKGRLIRKRRAQGAKIVTPRKREDVTKSAKNIAFCVRVGPVIIRGDVLGGYGTRRKNLDEKGANAENADVMDLSELILRRLD